MRHFLFAIFFFLSSSVCLGSSIDKQEFTKIQKQLSKVSQLKVSFVQLIYNPRRKRMRQKKGVAFFSQPASFRWEVHEPAVTKEEFIFDGKTLIIYKPNEKAAIRLRGIKTQAQQFRNIANLLLNPNTLFKHYDLVKGAYVQKKSKVSLQLKPKRAIDVQAVDLVINLGKDFVEKVEIKYDTGRVFTFVFKSPSRQYISKGTFSFQPPAGVKIEDFSDKL